MEKIGPLGNDFIFGVNLPWFDGEYGHDIGPESQHADWTVWYSSNKVSEYFAHISNIGFSVVRIWLMERAEGWEVNQDGIITNLNSTFLVNLADLESQAHKHNLKLYLCLTTSWEEVEYPSPINNIEQQNAYIENAVVPIIQLFKGSKDIFAFDIFNEIESDLRPELGNHQATIEDASCFIRRIADVINQVDPNRLKSSGSGYHSWEPIQAGYYNNLGLDFYDFHTYSDTGELPSVLELRVNLPVIIGEVGQESEEENDDLQSHAIELFLRNAIEKGYAGCFIWAFGPYEEWFHLINNDNTERPAVSKIRSIIQEYNDS